MLEVSRGELPKEYKSWDEINHKIPVEWRDGKAGSVSVVFDTPDTMPDAPNSGSNRKGQVAGLGNQAKSIVEEIPEDSLLRTPKASDGQGGALGEAEALKRGNSVGIRDQVLDLAVANGLPVTRAERNEEILLPTVLANSPMRTSRRAMTTKEGGYAHVSLNQAIELAQGVLPREFESWDEVPESVRPVIEEEALLPTPSVAHLRNHDEDIDGYLQRRQDYLDGKTKGMPGASLGVMVRMVGEGEDLLPTPTTMDTKATNNAETAQKFIDEGRQTCLTYEVTLLPTPQAMEGEKGNNLSVSDRAATGQVMLSNYAVEFANNGPALLPTVRVSSANGSTAKEREAGNPKNRLETEAEINDPTRWGKFEPAIRRWETILGRKAPAPTKPDGKDGAHRLSSSFTEWMMGLPEGWITDAGLKRAEELKACGNGVVPQQAALALRLILAELKHDTKEGN